MRKQSALPFILFASLLAMLFVGCQSAATPQAKMFDTLKAAAVGIDSFRASYEAAAATGQITAEQKAKADKLYNEANDAIILAAKTLRDVGGMSADTPEQVDAAVRALAELITTIIPPKPH